MFLHGSKYSLHDIIDVIIRSNEEYIMDIYDLYIEKGNHPISPALPCFISTSSIKIDAHDHEIHPEFVANQNLEYFCSGQLLEDVVLNAIHQKEILKNSKKLTIEQITISLEYYLEKDTFLDLVS